MARSLDAKRPIRVGVIGAGEVAQVIHLPTLSLLSHLYSVVAICDVSEAAVEHACNKFHIAHGFRDTASLIARDDIDLVVVASADEYHCDHVIAAIEAGKHVLVEKPMTLTKSEAAKIEQARQKHGVAVYVGYMRRYTPAWATFLEELRKAGPISFMRVFDYSGPNSIFVGQSSTFPQVFGADLSEDTRREKRERSVAAAEKALGSFKAQNARLVTVYRLLASLGSHDLSCMRHALGGVPSRCTTAFASQDANFVGATFEYDQQPEGQVRDGSKNTPFQVSFEAGIHNIGVFPAHLEAFCEKAVVKIQYDTPYVKGLPIKVTVRENVGADGQALQEREIRPTFTDAYTAEFLRLERALRSHGEQNRRDQQEALDAVHWGSSAEMCTPSDAVKDLEVFDMIMQHLK